MNGLSITAHAQRLGAVLPASIPAADWPAFLDLLRSISSQFGSVTKAASFVGSGSSGAGAMLVTQSCLIWMDFCVICTANLRCRYMLMIVCLVAVRASVCKTLPCQHSVRQ